LIRAAAPERELDALALVDGILPSKSGLEHDGHAAPRRGLPRSFVAEREKHGVGKQHQRIRVCAA
jgi:hypothetical protein